ncbi:MAG: Fe-S cluster assembly protein SufD [Candidatus Korobacteraceae bacterium]
MVTATEYLGSYLDSFADFEKHASGRGLEWLQSLRRKAFTRFCQVGFPTTHDEDWRFTNVSEVARTSFRLAQDGAPGLAASDLREWRIAGEACLLVFVNGHFSRALSSLDNLPRGLTVGGLAENIDNGDRVLQEHMGRYLDTNRDAFCALNTAFAEDGGYVHIRRGAVIEGAIHLLFVSTETDTPAMSHPRNLIVAEEDSQAAIVEDYVSLGSGVAFCNSATEVVASDNAVLSHYMIEQEHTQTFNVSTLRIQQGRSANVASHSVLVGGALVRNNVHPVLAGEGSECLINGLFVGSGRQHIDNYMLVEHVSPHCGSRQFYNGILDDRAHGVFHGRIIVHKDAQKTDAKQTNRNLLLSDDAQIDTKPQLEIYADDVKCTHGATIGQIEADALFYLRSRGIDEASARRILLVAFANECLERMKEGGIRKHVEKLINERVLQMATVRGGAATNQVEARREDAGRRLEEIA